MSQRTQITHPQTSEGSAHSGEHAASLRQDGCMGLRYICVAAYSGHNLLQADA
jgi:hypothetical protein